jgi:hypothetical protein
MTSGSGDRPLSPRHPGRRSHGQRQQPAEGSQGTGRRPKAGKAEPPGGAFLAALDGPEPEPPRGPDTGPCPPARRAGGHARHPWPAPRADRRRPAPRRTAPHRPSLRRAGAGGGSGGTHGGRWPLTCDRRHNLLSSRAGVAGGATPARRAGCVTMWRQGDVNAQNSRLSPGAAVTESPLHETILLSSPWPSGSGESALAGATPAGRVAVTTAVARSPHADPPPGGLPRSGRPVAPPALPAVDMTISRRSSK